MTHRYLVEFNRDWADEFNVYGLLIIDKYEWEETIGKWPDVEWGFGTNQDFEEGELDDGDFRVKEITTEDEEHLKALIRFRRDWSWKSGWSFGHFPTLNEDGNEDDEE